MELERLVAAVRNDRYGFQPLYCWISDAGVALSTSINKLFAPARRLGWTTPTSRLLRHANGNVR